MCDSLDISQFLCAFRTQESSKTTLVSMISPKGKYAIPPSDMERFWQLYGHSYADMPLGLAEIQTDTMIPVIVDVDLKQENGSVCDGLYSIKHVHQLVRIYQKVLRDIIEDVPDEALTCFLLEKPPYQTQKQNRTFVKNGFHLHFPRLFLSRKEQEMYLLPRVRLECKRLAPSELPVGVTADSYIDRAYCRGHGIPWLLYGSRKDSSQASYTLSTVFDWTGSISVDWRSALCDYVVYHHVDQRIPLDNGNLDCNLPRIFSLVSAGRDLYHYHVRADVSATTSSLKKDPTPRVMMTTVALTTEETEQMVEQLLPLLSDHRAVDRNEWMMVGWILYNIFKGDVRGYDYWVAFSKRCPSSFDEAACDREWSLMTQKDLTMGSLKYMARMDNPTGYAQVAKEWMRPHLEKNLKLGRGTHHDFAQALYQRYENEFVCASIVNRVWYQFEGHVWKRIEEGISLRRKLSDELALQYDELANDMMKKIANAVSEEESVLFKSKLAKIWKLSSALRSAPFKANVMKEAMEIFYQADFSHRLDTNPYLIAFSNGVYDLCELKFRHGRPEDYMSIQMPISYREELTESDPGVVAVKEYFAKIFPDQSVREYFLFISAEVFSGGNSRKIVQVWSGEGDNGKSITQSLFEKMLGPYNVKLPTSLIVGKRTQSSSACPELCRAGHGVRFAMLQEPDQKDVINVGILKELSGNDTFFARGLYKEGGEITPMFKLALVCNDTPKLPHNDKAAWNRIRVIPFESTFTNEAPDDIDEQLRLKRFPKDTQFADKIPSMIEPMAWYLIELYKVKPRVIQEPAKVMSATLLYQKRNDIYQQFVEDMILERPEDRTVFVMLDDLYPVFKDWFRESIPHGHLPTKMEVCDHFIRKWGECDTALGSRRWFFRGLRSEFANLVDIPSSPRSSPSVTMEDDED